MKGACGAGATLVVLTLGMTWPLGARLTTELPKNSFDPLFACWAMGWVSRTLTAALGHPAVLAGFWNANIYFPEPQALAFSDHFIGQSLIVLPVYWLTGNLILCHNVAYLATFVLSGFGMFLLVRSLVTSPPTEGLPRAAGTIAGMTAAIVIAFNQFRLIEEAGDLDSLSIHWLPFALFGLHRYLVTDSRWALALGAFALIGLNVSSLHYMTYCAPFVAVCVLAEIVRLGRWQGRVWLELWAAAALVVVITAPIVLRYDDVVRRFTLESSRDELIRHSAILEDYYSGLPALAVPISLALTALLAGPRATLQARTRRTDMAWPLLALSLLAVWLSFGPAVSLGTRTLAMPALYPGLLAILPGYSVLLEPRRFHMVFLAFLAILAGLGAGRVAARWPRGATVACVILMTAYLAQLRDWAVTDYLLRTPSMMATRLSIPPGYLQPASQLPPIYRDVQSLSSDTVLLELPFGELQYERRYMFFAAMHQRRLVNGASRVSPPSYRERRVLLDSPLIDAESATRALAGATHVIVHTGAWADTTGATLAKRLEALGGQLLASADGALLFQMQTTERLARAAGQ